MSCIETMDILVRAGWEVQIHCIGRHYTATLRRGDSWLTGSEASAWDASQAAIEYGGGLDQLRGSGGGGGIGRYGGHGPWPEPNRGAV